jgi:hypothetical protein
MPRRGEDLVDGSNGCIMVDRIQAHTVRRVEGGSILISQSKHTGYAYTIHLELGARSP